jgi:hypothetical protein
MRLHCGRDSGEESVIHIRVVLGRLSAPITKPAVRKAGELAAVTLAAVGVMVPMAGCAHAAVAQAGTLTAKVTTALPATSTGCQPVWFIGARGSGQSASGYDGMGPEVDHMAQVVKSDLATKGLGMSLMAVNFADASVDVLKPNATVVTLLRQQATAAAITEWIHTSVDAFDASVNDGIQQAEDDAEAAVSECPNAKLVMGGYSQGSIAIHDAEVWLASNKPAVFSHVVGTLLLADPDRVPNTKAKTFGSPAAAVGDEGVRTYLCAFKYLCAVTPHDVPAPSTTANIVNSGDAVGDFKLSYLSSFSGPATVHTSYAKSVDGTMTYEPILATAANWVASLIPAEPSTQPAPTTPSGYQTGRQVSVVSQATGGDSGHRGPANSYAAGPLHPANSALWIVCYVNGQSITGPYGTEAAWDLGDDGYYYSDAWIWTGSNSPVVPVCSLKNVTVVSQASGGDSGHAGPSNSYAPGPNHPAGATIQIACYVDGQSITGPYGTETIWDLSTDGYYYADAWLWTDSNGAVVPHC